MKVTESLAALYYTFRAHGLDVDKIEIKLPKRDYDMLQYKILDDLHFPFSHDGKKDEIMFHGIKISRATDN